MNRRQAGGKPGKGKKSAPASRPGWGKRMVGFITILEQIPYGASMLQERRVARGVMGFGVLVMAVGSAFFALGWWQKWTVWVETAFFFTLAGWMMVILGFAFAAVGWAARIFHPRFK